MTRLLVVHPEAVAEVEDSAAWYEAMREGLGLEYLAAVDHAMASVAESPLLYPAWKTDLPWRRCVIRRFPNVVFFEVEDDRVVVWAVAHARRRPGYWVARQVGEPGR